MAIKVNVIQFVSTHLQKTLNWNLMESQIDCCSKKFGLGDYSNHLHDSHNDSCPKCEVLFHQNSEEEIIKHVRSCDPNEIVQESIYF